MSIERKRSEVDHMPEELPAVSEVADVPTVLAAIADPVRLEMVRRLAMAPDRTAACHTLYDGIGKSTASHHFKVLREAGLTERRYVEGVLNQRLRLEAVGERYPGLLDSVVGALDATPRRVDA